MKKTLLSFVFLAALITGALSFPSSRATAQETSMQASFDCAGASTPVETLICSQAELAELDRQLGLRFTAAQNTSNDAGRKARLREQREWLKTRLKTCGIPSSGKLPDNSTEMRTCLAREIGKRNEALAAAVKQTPATNTAAAAPFDSVKAAQAQELKIIRVTPSGNDVDKREQIVLQFNRPVVSTGKMDRDPAEIPVEISPEVNCQWRWLNSSALACNLDEADYLAPATRYTVKIRPGIKDENGATIAKAMLHAFVTARPRVLSSRLEYYSGTTPRGWAGPGIPLINVRFNQQVSRNSVAKALFIQAGAERYPLEVVAAPSESGTGKVFLFSLDKRVYALQDSRTTRDEAITDADPDREARLNWLVRPQKALPEDTEYTLQIKPGLVSALGLERGVENRVVSQGCTFPPFKFLGFSCTGNDNEPVFIAADGDSAGKCSALDEVSLEFSAPLAGAQVRRGGAITPLLGKEGTPLESFSELDDSDYSQWLITHKRGARYSISLPAKLRNNTHYTVALKGAAGKEVSGKTSIHDLFHRELPADITASFATDRYRPTFQWSGEPAVLEKNLDSDVSFYSANISRLSLQGQVLSAFREPQGLSREVTLPEEADQMIRSSFHVRDLFAGQSGIFSGTLAIQPETARTWESKEFTVQVTPFHVHAKVGTWSTLVWVTDLSSGQPVPEAEVVLYSGLLLAADPATKGKKLATGRTDAQGIALLPGSSELATQTDKNPQFSVLVQKDNDIAQLPFHYSFYSDAPMSSDDTTTAWGMTAEGVYKPGATVDYKIFVRTMRTEGASIPKDKDYTLEIRDPKGATVEKKKIHLSDFGTYSDTFVTGKTTPTGRFRVHLRSEDTSVFLSPLDFLVGDYVPAAFKVQTTLQQEIYEQGDEVQVDTLATLHSGGPYTASANRYFATLYGKPFHSSYPSTRDFTFGSPWCSPSQGCGKETLLDTETQLNQEGKAEARFIADGDAIGYGSLKVESAVEDDRGKKVANMATAEYFGADRFVGVRTDSWFFTAGKPAKFHFVVTDREGKPVDGGKVHIQSSGTRLTSFRVKGAGGAFQTRTDAEIVTDDDGKLELVSQKTADSFELVFPKAGLNSLLASVEDDKGRQHLTEIKVWVTGEDAVSWEEDSEQPLDFVPEKTSFQVGETANVLIKNPFPRAKALVTIERMGIVKSWVEDFDTSLPLLSFQITEEMVPNFNLSVVVFSPRIDTRQSDDTYDLGRPEFRMGYAQMQATGKKHSLDCTITTDRKEYKPRQEVQARVQITPRDGAPNARMELAVAVLDEAVFDLIKDGLDYFDPLKGLYSVRYDTVSNYNILQQLVTHAPTLDEKGDDPGGDGGLSERMRSELKSLAYWNSSLLTDDQGRADFSFQAPDNLTGWRILVLAADQADHLGLGHSNFKVNRPTEIQPAMPNQVVEGDRFVAAFTVMNRTAEKRKITVELAAGGTLAAPAAPTREEVEIEPFQRRMVKLALTAGRVPLDRQVDKGDITFTVTAGDGSDRDALTHHLPVHKKQHLDIGADYGTSTEGRIEMPLLFPEKIRPDAGDVTITLSPTLVGDLEGAFRFMRDYPYGCWEQVLSRAVMAAAFQSLQPYLSPDFVWKDSTDAVAQVLAHGKDFQAPNGGMAFFKPDSERVDPYLSAFTALSFTMLEGMGYKTPEAMTGKLNTYLLEMLRTDVLPSFYSKGMASSVRAVALAALARQGRADAAMFTRHLEHIEQMDLFGQAQMLETALRLGNQEAQALQIADRILGTSNETGGRITFNETLDDGYSRMLASPPRTNCAVLSSLLLLADTEAGAAKLQDIPVRLARSIRTMRGQRDHFENSQENLFCAAALLDYARRYEKDAPAMDVTVDLAGKPLGQDRFTSFQAKPLVVTHPIAASDPGTRQTVGIDKKGDGRLYYATVMRYAPLADQETGVNAGLQIDREYYVEERDHKGWRLLNREDHIRRGDLVRVDLYLRLPAARTQVVVDDPIPGGLEPVNTELATASEVDADKAGGNYAGNSLWMRFSDWHEYSWSFWSFNHQELQHHAARFFAEYLPPGNYHLAYMAQAVAEGDYTTQPVFGGEMYDQDIYGKGVSGILHVDP